MVQDLTKRGARLFENSPALAITGQEVTTPHGTIRCQKVIVAVDGRLEMLLPELRGRVKTARLQMLATAPDLPVRFPRPVYSRYGYDYWQQLPDGRLGLGGFRDHFRDQEWTPDDTPTEEIQHKLERHLREHLQITAPITHRWGASVSYTDTGLPILDEVRPSVWAIGGYSGTGNLIGALCGRSVARIVLGHHDTFADVVRGSNPPG